MITVDSDALELNLHELSARLCLGASGTVSLSLPDASFAAERFPIDRTLAELRSAVRCAYCYRESTVITDKSDCTFDFGTVNSPFLAKYLSGTNRVYVLAATLGIGADRAIRAAEYRSVTDQFLLDAVASAMIEALCDYAQERLPNASVSRVSAGYCGIPLDLQPAILAFLDAKRKLGIHLSETCLMTPTKSVTAIIRIEEPKP